MTSSAVSEPILLECSICGEKFDDKGDNMPRALRCGHTFTSKCLVKLVINDRVRCPICRSEHLLPFPGAQIPVNSAILEVVKQYNVESGKLYQCQVCNLKIAQVYCIDCVHGSKYFFCQACDQREHNRPFKPVHGHQRFKISTKKWICSRHGDKQPILYSEKLSQFACEECMTSSDWQARSAMFVPIPDALNKLRSRSQNLSIFTLKAIHQLEESKQLISETLRVLHPKSEVISKFENMLDLVNKRRVELLDSVEKEKIYRKQQLQKQLKEIINLTMMHREAYEDLNCLECKSDMDFLLFSKVVTGNMEALLASEDKSLLRPALIGEIPFFIEDIEQQLKTLTGPVGGGTTPTDLECVTNSKGCNIMQLTWLLPEWVLHFQIEYKHLRDYSMFCYQSDHIYMQREPQFYRVSGNELSTFVDYLCPGYRYQFRIRSANAAGWGMWSKPIIGRCEDFPITVGYTKKIYHIRIPFYGYYCITAKGAKAADGKMHCGGRGAVITATFCLKPGDVLIILCGGMSMLDKFSTGGGGGTFVAVNEINHENLLIAAGGGGGTRGFDENDFDGCDASLEPSGTDGRGREHGKGGVNSSAGEDANPDDFPAPSWGHGGAGFLQDSTTAASFLKGGHGGQCGGFGGGGAIGQYGGGGGGGYSGGGGGRGGGGGGSFVRSDGADIEKELGNQSHGSVIIEKVPGGHEKFNEGSFILSSSGGIHGSISELKLQEKHSTSIPAISLSKDDKLSHKVMMKGENCKTFYFSEAEERAHIPFIHHHLMECDHNGLEYTVKEHDITLRIPEGAVAEGETIHLEIGVAIYGPFNFPENGAPISPIIWLCIQEETALLMKPFQLILPHFLTGLNRDRLNYHQIEFAKANHCSYSIAEDKQMIYNFNVCDAKPLFTSSGYKSYGVLSSTHCCFYCLKANQTPELANDTSYCLARVERSLSPRKNEVYFAAVYLLNTCVQALQEQFPEKDNYKISRYGAFKFKAEQDTELCIRVIPPHELDRCVVALDPNPAEIRESNINFWKKDFTIMKLQHETRMYPPRVKMTVTLINPDQILKLPVKFEGCSSDSQLNADITFPLGNELPSQGSSPIESHPGYSSHTIFANDDQPKLKDVFKRLIPLASSWKTIGGLLGVERHILDNIKKDEDGVRDCLHAMLSEWLKQVDPRPTWTDIVDAVKEVDLSKAEEIRQHIAR